MSIVFKVLTSFAWMRLLQLKTIHSRHPLTYLKKKQKKKRILRQYLLVCVRGKTYASDFSSLAAQLRYFHLAETTDPSLIQFLALIVHTYAHIHTQKTFLLCTHNPTHTHHAALHTQTHTQTNRKPLQQDSVLICWYPGREKKQFLVDVETELVFLQNQQQH